MQNAVINIKNLRLRTYIGFNPEEQEKKQDVVLNIQVHYSGEKAALYDNVKEALNYKFIAKTVIKHVEEGRFLLLEKLVADVLEICTEHPWTTYANVEIDKPHALRFADSVSLSLSWLKKE